MKTYSETIDEYAQDFIAEWKEELEKIIQEELKAGWDENYVFDESIYQDWDIYDKLHNFLDGAWYSFLREDWAGDYDSELTTCARILDLSRNVEEDSGLWEGKEPAEAIATQAFFTTRSDLYYRVEELLKELISDLSDAHEKEEEKGKEKKEGAK